jgi:hypothetical protein
MAVFLHEKYTSLSFPLICDFRTSVLSFPHGLKNMYGS